MIAIGVGYGLHRGKSAFGVDFLGGDTTIFAFDNKAWTRPPVRAALAKAGIKDPLIQYQTDLSHRAQDAARRLAPPGPGNTVVTVVTELPDGAFQQTELRTMSAPPWARKSRSPPSSPSLLSLVWHPGLRGVPL